MFQELIKSVLKLWNILPLVSLKKFKKYEAITLGSLVDLPTASHNTRRENLLKKKKAQSGIHARKDFRLKLYFIINICVN